MQVLWVFPLQLITVTLKTIISTTVVWFFPLKNIPVFNVNEPECFHWNNKAHLKMILYIKTSQMQQSQNIYIPISQSSSSDFNRLTMQIIS